MANSPSPADQFLLRVKDCSQRPASFQWVASCPDWAVLQAHRCCPLCVGLRLTNIRSSFHPAQIDLDTLLTQAMQKRTQIFAFAFAFEMG
jgi:hypothetical protein